MKSRLMMIGLAVMAIAWLAGASATVARAADNGTLKSMSVLVWPEYDDPRVLVQYEGEFNAAETFPRDVFFYVPAGSQIFATAYADTSGNLMNTPQQAKLDTATDGGVQKLTVNLPTNLFHIEFYYDPLPKNVTDKSFDFVFKAAQQTGMVNFQIQQPLKAENFKTDPAATQQTSSNHGFKNHLFAYPSVADGTALKVKVSYTKTDPLPSVDSVSASLPAGTPNPQAPAASSSSAPDATTYIPLVIGAAALALAALAFFAWRSRQEAELRPVPAGPRPRRKGRPAQTASYFCTKCGNGLDEDDMYCPSCGTKRRA